MADEQEITSPLESPTTPDPQSDAPTSPTPTSPNGSRMSPRAHSDMGSSAPVSNMTASSTPLGTLNAARRPAGPAPNRSTQLPQNIAEKMKQFSLSRAQPPPRPGGPPGGASFGPGGANPLSPPSVQSPGPQPGGMPSAFKLPPHMSRPQPHMANSSPASPASKGSSLSERRGMKMPGGLPPATGGPGPSPAPGAGRKKPGLKLSDIGASADTNGNGAPQEPPKEQTQMEKYAQFLDPKTGALKFAGKATVNSEGIQFTSGKTFSISLDEVDTLDELGKGNYGTVYKVRHSRPKMRRPGQGLAGNKARGPLADEGDKAQIRHEDSVARGGTGIVMAMKEMRLELEDAKFQTIIMELDVLHRCASPYIVDFYGAFFQEGAVYICMEYMDGGSVDKIYGDGVPEGVLRKITLATVQGLKALKEDHNIIHRDVKPTNILVNTRGQVKICDFGVSGNLVASIAKTNIGCQSYMAPERISGGGMASAGAGPGLGTYSVQSDIWSLGLSIIECAMGRYPYPPETYGNIFSQLSAIVEGDPPDLPADSFSDAAHDFVAGCLSKVPNLRPTYPMLLQHAWLAPLLKPDTITEEDEEAVEAAENGDGELPESAPQEQAFADKEVGEWVIDALDKKKRGVLGDAAKPALHAAPLDAGMSPQPDVKPVAVDA